MNNKEKIVIICNNIFQVVGTEDKILFKFNLRDTNGGYLTPVYELKKNNIKINQFIQLMTLKAKSFNSGDLKIEHQKNDIFLVYVDKQKLTLPIDQKKRMELVKLVSEVDIDRKVRWVKK